MVSPDIPNTQREFFARAQQEARRYGSDPFVFVRELVQNSRDAGATTIAFSLQAEGNALHLVCEDDGEGMSAENVHRFLFRLFSSGKDGDGESAGRFGVGFWSVLRADPQSIVVDTHDGSAATAFCIVPDAMTWAAHPPGRAHRGTTITLTLAPGGPLSRSRLKAALHKYASPIRGVSGAPPPRLTLDGEVLNQALTPRGALCTPISGRGFDGFCGIGARASIRIYSHGLLVREATSLEELYPKRAPRTDPAHGLFPVASINADSLEVLLDRTRMKEDPLLLRVVDKIDDTAAGLRLEVLDEMAPLPFRQKLQLAWLHFSPRSLLLLAVGAMAIVAVFAVILPETPSARPSASILDNDPPLAPRSATNAIDPAAGPTINTPEGGRSGEGGWGLQFSGGPVDSDGKVFIKLRTFDTYDEHQGLTAVPAPQTVPYAYAPRSAGQAMTLDLVVPGGAGRISLPVPARHRVIRGQSTLNGEPIAGVVEAASGDAFLPLSPNDDEQLLTYQTRLLPHAPIGRGESPSVGGTFAEVPEGFRKTVQRARKMKRKQDRVRLLSAAVKKRIRYTTDATDAELFSQSARPWANKVSAFGAGDCDVMNGFLVLLLRAAGVPARLGVGFVGEGGLVADDLHAWTEYWLDSWEIIDVSPPQQRPRPRPAARDAAQPEAPGRDIPPSDIAGTPEGAASSELGDVPPDPPETAFTASSASSTWRPAFLRGLTLSRRVRGLLVLALSIPLFFIVWRWRRKRRDGDDDAMERCTIALFGAALDDPESALFQRLLHRAFFLRSDGTRASLADLDDECTQHDVPLAEAPADKMDFPRALDAACPRVRALAHRLPHVVRLDVARAWNESSINTELTKRIAERLRRVVPHATVRIIAGDGIESIRLPASAIPAGEADSRWPTLLLGIGADHPALVAQRKFRLTVDEVAAFAASAIVAQSGLGIIDARDRIDRVSALEVSS